MRLSGKKKRRLARDAKRLLADKAQMEGLYVCLAPPHSSCSSFDCSGTGQ